MNGKVYLVGAGPGDYKLLTIKGLEAIRNSDVIIYDRLINNNLLKEAKQNCEFIYVGKESSNHTLSQENINIMNSSLKEQMRQDSFLRLRYINFYKTQRPMKDFS